jgi:hypothetical protein
MYPIHPLPGPVNNSPPVLTGLGKWQNRKAKLWTKLNPTISKDNTMGEAARQAKMLAEFAKNRPCMFGVKFDLQTSKGRPWQAHDEQRDRSLERALAVSRAEAGLPPQESRITGTEQVHLGPARRSEYELGEWDILPLER